MENSSNCAIPFISYNEKNGFHLNEEARVFLEELKCKRLGVISIVGKYRTGKSFFVNRVLLNESKAFAVGPTINPCTKGLWIWKKPLLSENGEYEDMNVIVIDTEGFGGIDEGVNHDTRIFLFSLLLSSYFIYNSVGSIDEATLNSLSLIVNLAKDIQTKVSKNRDQGLETFFPSFLWVVRDFALRMEDAEGKPITSKEYMEKALDMQKGVSDSVEGKNRIRRLIKHFFVDRDCATMIRPTQSEKDLQIMDSLSNSDLRPEFIDQINKTRSKIFKKVKPKSLFGQDLTPSMFLDLCKSYIEAVNGGSVPVIENSWTYVIKQEANKNVRNSLQELQTILDKKKSSTRNSKDLKEELKEVRRNILKGFRKSMTGNELVSQEFEEILNRQLKKEIFLFTETKESEAQKESLILIEKLSQFIQDRLAENFYEDINEFMNDKESEAEGNENAQLILNSFIKSLQKKALISVSQGINGRSLREMEAKLEAANIEISSLRDKRKIDKSELERLKTFYEEKLDSQKAKIDELSHTNTELHLEAESSERRWLEKSKSLMEAQRKTEKEASEILKAKEQELHEQRKEMFGREKALALAEQKANFLEDQVTRLQNCEKESREIAHRLFEAENKSKVFF